MVISPFRLHIIVIVGFSPFLLDLKSGTIASSTYASPALLVWRTTLLRDQAGRLRDRQGRLMIEAIDKTYTSRLVLYEFCLILVGVDADELPMSITSAVYYVVLYSDAFMYMSAKAKHGVPLVYQL